MRTHRTPIFIGALFAALAVAAPGQALASSLLSGYGGPGQGNQAVLGSTLIGGKGGGGGSGASSGGSSGTSLAQPTTAPSSQGSATGSTQNVGTGAGSSQLRHGAAHRGARAPHSTPAARDGNSTAVQGAPGAQSLYPAAERIPAGSGSGVLGLSGSDLLYIVLAFVALAFTGLLTARFGRSYAAGRHSRLKG